MSKTERGFCGLARTPCRGLEYATAPHPSAQRSISTTEVEIKKVGEDLGDEQGGFLLR